MQMQSVIPIQQYTTVPTVMVQAPMPGYIIVGGMPTSRNDPEFGTHKTMKTHVPNIIQIRYKAEYFKYCCFSCNQLRDRQYFWVLENSIEHNVPVGCYFFPPNCICPGADDTRKHYFDRGLWDKQNCCFATGCYRGEPYVTNGYSKFCLSVIFT